VLVVKQKTGGSQGKDDVLGRTLPLFAAKGLSFKTIAV
jgi:hypothetical protein